ncbi:hypothetical protein BDV29DRAFT_165522 [Aspergillus leporis]|jgi:hypothetical protein|uniref:Uncharacterized protein n=1 Tax=Aspergillus leporis TaxID=41062 RepID=A0A5N5XDQ8_9EURO|nr:hypothetical protein BDV29DRAFT_165522 [Aspergillus leporis]
MSLTPDSLYIALYIRSDPPVRDDFHWALYLHRPREGTGTGIKYHIRNAGTPGWIAAHAPETSIMSTFLLVGLLRIADLSATSSRSVVDRLIRAYDDRINEMDVTCRTWLFKALELLNEEKFLREGEEIDLGALEREVMDWGNEVAKDATKNVQPRPIGASKVCGF